MTSFPDATSHGRRFYGVALVAGVTLAALTEAIAGTVLSLGRADVAGDVHATPDEVAWLDIIYTASKILSFGVAPWMMNQLGPNRVIVGATLVMAAACAVSILTPMLELLLTLRLMQGFAGGAMLVAGQALLFLNFGRSQQPILQALFAAGAVVAPTTIAPALQGWLLDDQSWTSVFLSVVPLALGAIGLLLASDDLKLSQKSTRPFDWIGFVLFSTAAVCITYVLNQGSRWNWFEDPKIFWLTIAGVVAVTGCAFHQIRAGRRGLFDFSVFDTPNFTFAFVVSFVAGAALFGSAYLIPAFALSVLSFTPTDAGLLLLPSGALFLGSLALSALLIQFRKAPPIATVPLGIFLTTVAMWMLSGSTNESGPQDLAAAILLRGLGLGFLFLSITLIAFSAIDHRRVGSAIGLFNLGRQLGGLVGVAGLQTLIDRSSAANFSLLASNVVSGAPAVSERLTAATAIIAEDAIDPAATERVATMLLTRAVGGQAVVIAFEAAFFAIALLFIIAAPVIAALRIALSRQARSKAPTSSGGPRPDFGTG